MDIPEEIDDYIKHSIDHLLGLPVPHHFLRWKLRSSEEALTRSKNHYLHSISKLKRVDEAIEKSREEVSMSAREVRALVEERRKLKEEWRELGKRCEELENECGSCERDRDALMEFGNVADERAVEMEWMVMEMEGKLETAVEELRTFKTLVG